MQKAIDEDVNQNYAEAYKLYQNALDYFMMALKCTLWSSSYSAAASEIIAHNRLHNLIHRREERAAEGPHTEKGRRVPRSRGETQGPYRKGRHQ